MQQEILHRNAKSQRNVIVAQKCSSYSVAQSSGVVTNHAIEEVTAENAIREAAAERKRQHEPDLLAIDNAIKEISMELSFGEID